MGIGPRVRGNLQTVSVAVSPPIMPMLAKRVSSLPVGSAQDDWIFEPKWDGFRALVFRDDHDVYIQSRDAKPLVRYYPELVDPLLAQLPPRCVLDGEIVIAREGALDFDALQLRLHPAASRVKTLSHQMPASIVFFDLLCQDNCDLQALPFGQRRAMLENLLAVATPPLHLTPATRDHATALDWFHRFEGAGLDGVMAKQSRGAYEPNKRVMLKVKHERDCDCVVAGFRWHKNGQGTGVGSLLLGLYDAQNELQHVGVCSSFTDVKRRELVNTLVPYRMTSTDAHPWQQWAAGGGAGETRSMPGGASRWSNGKDLSWIPLRPELVVEVAYDHMQGTRFRHIAQFRRWRADKQPNECTYAQLEVVPPHELAEIFTNPGG